MAEVAAGAPLQFGRVVPRLQLQVSRNHQAGLLLQGAVAIGVIEGISFDASDRQVLSVEVDDIHAEEMLSDATTLGSGIHHGRTTHGAGNAHSPLEALETLLGGVSRQRWDRFSAQGPNPASVGIHIGALQSTQTKRQAGKSCIGNQQIGAGADHTNGEVSIRCPVQQRSNLIRVVGFG